MDTSLLSALFTVANSSPGLGVGIAIGLPLGIPIGSSIGAKSARKRIIHKLNTAMNEGDISISDKNGNSITAEALFQLLQERAVQAKQ